MHFVALKNANQKTGDKEDRGQRAFPIELHYPNQFTTKGISRAESKFSTGWSAHFANRPTDAKNKVVQGFVTGVF